jgi:hypothetical protein
VKQAHVRDMFKNSSESVCTAAVMVSSVSMSLTPPTCSAVKTVENAEKDLDTPEPAAEEDAGIVVQPKYRSSNKKLPVRMYVYVGTVR